MFSKKNAMFLFPTTLILANALFLGGPRATPPSPTTPPNPHQQQPATAGNTGGGRRFIPDQQSNLEQSLLATIAANDPKVAYQKASESLDKGEYPTALSRVLSQLQAKDPESFKKLSDKALSRLSSDNIASTRDAALLAATLLMPGPRPASTSTATPTDATATNARDIVRAQTAERFV